MTLRAAALLCCLLYASLLTACGQKACETELDCVIICTCQPSGREITVGPYECNQFGTCGTSFDEDVDCVRPCDGLPPLIYPNPDDDDSAVSDDDDSAAR